MRNIWSFRLGQPSTHRWARSALVLGGALLTVLLIAVLTHSDPHHAVRAPQSASPTATTTAPQTAQNPPTAPQHLAALVNGIPISMAAYLRQLRFAVHGYTGAKVDPQSATGRSLLRLQEDQAIQQAIAEALIDRAAAQHGVALSKAEIDGQVARIEQQSGGASSLDAHLRTAQMSREDLRRVAAHTLLRDHIGALLHDPAWLNHAMAAAQITYYVGDGAIAAPLAPAIALGHPAPALVAVDLRNKPVSLAALRGQPVILTFWATWCTACRGDLTLLTHFSRTHPHLHVVFVNSQQDLSTVQAFALTYKLPKLSVWRDATGQAGQDYTVTSLPATFFIDRRGMLRSYNFGVLAGAQAVAMQATYAINGTNNTHT